MIYPRLISTMRRNRQLTMCRQTSPVMIVIVAHLPVLRSATTTTLPSAKKGIAPAVTGALRPTVVLTRGQPFITQIIHLSPSANSRNRPPKDRADEEEEEGARHPGSNLFVTGIAPRLSETEVSRLFEKYGEVEGCSIMKDPHSQESRGFGFVKMVTGEQADAAKEGLQGETIEGRTLSIEKARRSRPRTPTPGKYFGPPKRGMYYADPSLTFHPNRVPDDFRGPPRGGRYDRFDDRRGGGSRGSGRYDDSYRGSRYDDRDRRYYGRRDDYAPRNIDRYASGGREDRYSSRGDDYRGGSGGDYYARDSGRSGGYGEGGAARESRDSYGAGRDHDDRYSRR